MATSDQVRPASAVERARRSWLLLLLISALLGDLVGIVVGLFDCIVGALLTGDGGRELLTYARAEILKLRDLDELDPGVRHRFDGRLGRISLLDGVQRDRRERCGVGLVARCVVGG